MLCRKTGGNQRSPDRSRGHGVDTDPLSCQIFIQRTGKPDNRTFGGTIVYQILPPLISDNAGCIYNGIPLLQEGKGGFGEIEHRENIGPEGPLRHIQVDLLQTFCRVLLTCLVDKHIESSERLDRKRTRLNSSHVASSY